MFGKILEETLVYLNSSFHFSAQGKPSQNTLDLTVQVSKVLRPVTARTAFPSSSILSGSPNMRASIMLKYSRRFLVSKKFCRTSSFAL